MFEWDDVIIRKWLPFLFLARISDQTVFHFLRPPKLILVVWFVTRLTFLFPPTSSTLHSFLQGRLSSSSSYSSTSGLYPLNCFSPHLFLSRSLWVAFNLPVLTMRLRLVSNPVFFSSVIAPLLCVLVISRVGGHRVLSRTGVSSHSGLALVEEFPELTTLYSFPSRQWRDWKPAEEGSFDGEEWDQDVVVGGWRVGQGAFFPLSFLCSLLLPCWKGFYWKLIMLAVDGSETNETHPSWRL